MEDIGIQQLFAGIQLLALQNEYGEKLIYEGSNRKQVLVITTADSSVQHYAFLEKILGAVNIGLNDIALIHSENLPLFHHLKSGIQFKKMLLFGITPRQLGLHFRYENYLAFTFQDIEIMASISLAQLDDSEPAKRLLWKALKKMFADHVQG